MIAPLTASTCDLCKKDKVALNDEMRLMCIGEIEAFLCKECQHVIIRGTEKLMNGYARAFGRSSFLEVKKI